MDPAHLFLLIFGMGSFLEFLRVVSWLEPPWTVLMKKTGRSLKTGYIGLTLFFETAGIIQNAFMDHLFIRETYL